MQAPLKFNTQKRRREGFLLRTFRKLERWTTLAGFKEFLKNKAVESLHAEGFKKTMYAIILYSLYAIVTFGQFAALSLFTLSIVANVAGSTTPMLATLANSELSITEKIKNITGFTDKVKVEKEDESRLNCSNTDLHWRTDLNTYVNGNRMFLKTEKNAGTIILREPVSSFLGLEAQFKSSMQSGINIIISFKNSDGTLKYAIGDGDFWTIRYSYIDKDGILRIQQVLKLENSIYNAKEIGFKLTTLEKADGILASAVVSYYDIYGRLHNQDLEDLNIPNPHQVYLNIGIGIDAGLETQKQNAYIELLGCSIMQTEPSKLLNI